MKHAFKILAVLSILCLTTAAIAQDSTTKPSKKMAGVRGKVQKIDGTKITIMSRDGEKVIDTDDSTKFTLDGAAATLADVKEDERVVVMPETGVATDVKIMTQKRRKDKDGSKEPTTAPAGNTTVAPADAK